MRIDKLDPEMLRLMKKSGCYQMSLGIESANQRILDMIKHYLNNVGWLQNEHLTHIYQSIVEGRKAKEKNNVWN